LPASLAILQKMPEMNLDEMPVSGCKCLSTVVDVDGKGICECPVAVRKRRWRRRRRGRGRGLTER
jgi:hypothetical protein